MLWGMDMIKKSEPLASEHGKNRNAFFLINQHNDSLKVAYQSMEHMLPQEYGECDFRISSPKTIL